MSPQITGTTFADISRALPSFSFTLIFVFFVFTVCFLVDPNVTIFNVSSPVTFRSSFLHNCSVMYVRCDPESRNNRAFDPVFVSVL